MSDSSKKCPVCDGPARDITVAIIDGKSFKCGRCGDFDVSGTVLAGDMLAPYDGPSRIAILERAKERTQPGKRPLITTYGLYNG